VSKLRVEVVYALPEAQHLIELDMTAGATIADALNRVRTAPGFADVDLDHASVGIFGRVVTDRTQRLNEGDRVEIYRPLTIDPMTARRLRATRPAE
jgi:putative ubiquitin-RnfH superfamily antitoxin RatB of RatAB toxin-antitoxin module